MKNLLAIVSLLVAICLLSCGNTDTGGGYLLPIDPPSNLSALAGLNSVELSWQELEGYSYRVYYGTESLSLTGSDAKEGSSPIETETNHIKLTELEAEITYYFAVSVFDRTGESKLSGEVSAIPLSDKTDEGDDPPIITLSQSIINYSCDNQQTLLDAGSIEVTNAGDGILSWAAISTESWLTITPKSGTAPGTITFDIKCDGLTEGLKSAFITVSAPNISSASTEISLNVTTPALILPPPENFSKSTEYLTHNCRYTFSWDAPISPPESVSGYRLYRQSNGGPWYESNYSASTFEAVFSQDNFTPNSMKAYVKAIYPSGPGQATQTLSVSCGAAD